MPRKPISRKPTPPAGKEEVKLARFIMKPREVRRVFGDCSNTTLWRRVRAGLIPPPILLGPNLRGWWSDVIYAAAEALPLADSNPGLPKSVRQSRGGAQS